MQALAAPSRVRILARLRESPCSLGELAAADSTEGHGRGVGSNRQAADQRDDPQGQAHSHGLVDRSIGRSRAGVKAVSISLAVLMLTTLVQVLVYLLSGSVALLA